MKIETKQVPAKTIDVQKSVVSYVTEIVVLEPAREEYTLTLTRDELFALRGLGSYGNTIAKYKECLTNPCVSDGPTGREAYAKVLNAIWYATNPIFGIIA